MLSFQTNYPTDCSEAIMRARAYVAFERGNYRDLYSILQVIVFTL